MSSHRSGSIHFLPPVSCYLWLRDVVSFFLEKIPSMPQKLSYPKLSSIYNFLLCLFCPPSVPQSNGKSQRHSARQTASLTLRLWNPKSRLLWRPVPANMCPGTSLTNCEAGAEYVPCAVNDICHDSGELHVTLRLCRELLSSHLKVTCESHSFKV